jgi:uncharacterized protein (DUF433 family)
VTETNNTDMHRGTKLTHEDVLEIAARCKAGETQKAVAADYPVSAAMVGRIMSGLNWNDVTGIEPHKPGYVRGEAAPSAKLTREQVVEIVRRCEAGERYGSVARDFPVRRDQVSSIMCGQSWAHVTGFEVGIGPRRGSDKPGAKLTEADVLEIVRRHEAGEPQTHIAKDYPVNQSTISKIVRGTRWSPVTGIESE